MLGAAYLICIYYKRKTSLKANEESCTYEKHQYCHSPVGFTMKFTVLSLKEKIKRHGQWEMLNFNKYFVQTYRLLWCWKLCVITQEWSNIKSTACLCKLPYILIKSHLLITKGRIYLETVEYLARKTCNFVINRTHQQ